MAGTPKMQDMKMLVMLRIVCEWLSVKVSILCQAVFVMT